VSSTTNTGRLIQSKSWLRRLLNEKEGMVVWVLRAVSCELRVANCELRTVNCEL
jgi:hypothetical protein